MGERVLQIGIDDPAIAGAIAAKVGVSGHAAIAVADERAAAAARNGGRERDGASPTSRSRAAAGLPFDDASFDLVVLNAQKASWRRSTADTAAELLREAHRVLRDRRPGRRDRGGHAGRAVARGCEPSKPADAGGGIADALASRVPRRSACWPTARATCSREGLKPEA